MYAIRSYYDEKQFTDWIFRGSWGVSDEDIFARPHQELLAHGDKPFLTFVSYNFV